MSTAFERLIRHGSKPFDEARAARTLESLGTFAGQGAARELLSSAASNSPYLARAMVQESVYIPQLLATGPADTFEAIIGQVEREPAETRGEMLVLLRQAKRRAAILIALADLGGIWSLDEVTAALTRLADATLTRSLRFALHDAEKRGRLVGLEAQMPERGTGLFFVAMGKYGAGELNYSSDIDFSCYFDDALLPVAEGVEPRELAVRLTQASVGLMQEVTPDGYVFRCDLRLRPDAGSTQIAVSTNAAEHYYETKGQNWERAAMIKARAAVGDIQAGERFLTELQPFVWRKYLDYAAISDIHSIKRQIHAHAGHGEVAVAGHDIKLGRGGIREIEFFAQTQQLILGGRIPMLREKRTLDALAALAQRKIITQEAASELSEAYRFLRTLEHRLQMVEDEQTHSLPKTGEGLDNIARFMGFAETRVFEDELRARLTRVQSHYARLFESAPALSEESGSLVFTGVEDDPETIATLRRLNFSQPSAVAATIRGWHHGRVRATRSEKAREKLTALMPLLLNALGKTANPDIAFTRFDRFLSGLPSGVQVFALLYSNPRLLDLIAEIVGTAPRLADHLARRPALLDVLIDADFLRDRPTVERLRDSLFTLLRPAKSFEERLDVVRRWTKDQQFRVGLQLLQGEADGATVGRGFTDIADAAIVALTAVVEDAAIVSHGRVAGGAMAVIGMGRLGGFEMTASSDLDLIFVYEHIADAPASDGPKPLAPSVYYARTSQHLITALTVMTGEGGLYDVDMRLRPSGNKGPVAVSLATFENYQASEAWTWERLALTRARVIAGPPALRAKVEAAIQAALQRGDERGKVLADIADMRLRLEKERAAKTLWDLKEVPGGLFDVEFIVQGAQLLHAPATPEVLNVNTLAALDALDAEGAIAAKDATLLRAAAKLYQALTQVLRLAVEGEFEPVDASPSLKGLIARAAGLPSFDAAEEQLGEMQTQVRALFLRWVKAPGR